MVTLSQIVDIFKQDVKHTVIESLQEAGYDNATATKLVTQFEGLEAQDLTFESDSEF
jgi:hypothetical protein